MLRTRHMMNAYGTPNHLTSPQINAFAVYFAGGASPWDKKWRKNPSDGDLDDFKLRFERVFTDECMQKIRRESSVGSLSTVLNSEARKLAGTVGQYLSSDVFSKVMGFCLRSLQACTPARQMAKPPILPRHYTNLEGFGADKLKVRWLSHSMA